MFCKVLQQSAVWWPLAVTSVVIPTCSVVFLTFESHLSFVFLRMTCDPPAYIHVRAYALDHRLWWPHETGPDIRSFLPIGLKLGMLIVLIKSVVLKLFRPLEVTTQKDFGSTSKSKSHMITRSLSSSLMGSNSDFDIMIVLNHPKSLSEPDFSILGQG